MPHRIVFTHISGFKLQEDTYQKVIVVSIDYSDFSVMKDNKEILRDLAVKIKILRKQHGLTQEQVLHDTGIHIARIEQGRRDISFTTAVRLADYFQVELDELIH